MSAKHDPEAAMHAAGVRDIPARDSGVLLIRADQVKSERVACRVQALQASPADHQRGLPPLHPRQCRMLKLKDHRQAALVRDCIESHHHPGRY